MSGNEVHSVKLTYLHHLPLAVLVESLTDEDAWMGLDCIEVEENLDALRRGDPITVEAPFWLLAKYGLDTLI